MLQRINEEEVDRLARLIHDRGATMVAVCLLHSYANPAHEQQLATLLRQSGLAVCTSHEVLPEYREFERWSTTVVNAYVTPLMDKYLGTLERTLTHARLSIMQSNGGCISAGAARASWGGSSCESAPRGAWTARWSRCWLVRAP